MNCIPMHLDLVWELYYNKVCQWSTDLTKVLYEAAIVSDKTKKASYIFWCIPMHLDLVWELYYTKNNRVRSESFVMPVEDLPRLRRTTHPISWSS
jgi:hypothetical protein